MTVKELLGLKEGVGMCVVCVCTETWSNGMSGNNLQ